MGDSCGNGMAGKTPQVGKPRRLAAIPAKSDDFIDHLSWKSITETEFLKIVNKLEFEYFSKTPLRQRHLIFF
ncbi:hypothetical protein HM131_02490 [Halobacillus mangrovi]|uniref:Uncharacterized protein n=1 Tax=Halobacillus mangrovi TaxID=402384 RepID=A0A1W5ZR46_9BACI|nr:hypothetical protein HM131_02490 [Halobacillus mangrovi]